MFNYDHKLNKDIALPPDDAHIGELEFAVVDTETCGTWKGSRMVEIACRIVGGIEDGKTIVHRVNPQIPIPPDATKIHGISNADVKTAPAADVVLKKILPIFKNRILVAHNSSFDEGIISTEAARHNMFIPRFPIIDTLKMSRSLLENQESYALGALAKELGIKHERAHTAESDVNATAELFLYLCNRLILMNEDNFGDLKRYGAISTLGTTAGPVESFPPRWNFLRFGLVTKAEVEIEYLSGDNIYRWPVTLMGAYSIDNLDYLEARDHRSNEIRTFRFDKIRAIYPLI
ncbi:hypothetical protein KKF34_19980 [Myxococcota bacterium]|nr:hypothetical protein [Myxococcota bacterium]MBU1382996.1 hypothetical protein [Myxococcota bacterium]MBU1499168.1 hypothetical protein [Myxococcota bacterium]